MQRAAFGQPFLRLTVAHAQALRSLEGRISASRSRLPGTAARAGHSPSRQASHTRAPRPAQNISRCHYGRIRSLMSFGNFRNGRGTGTRTRDLRFWRPSLYQLSYTPTGHLRPCRRLHALRTEFKSPRQTKFKALFPRRKSPPKRRFWTDTSSVRKPHRSCATSPFHAQVGPAENDLPRRISDFLRK